MVRQVKRSKDNIYKGGENLSAEQKILADTLAIVVGLIVYLFRVVFAILLLVLVVKAIKYFNNKNKNDCATCVYKQRCTQQESTNINQKPLFKDG